MATCNINVEIGTRSTQEKILGKIVSAEFGKIHDRPELMGLKLRFKLADGSSVGDGGKYTENMGKECKWSNPCERLEYLSRTMDQVYRILNDAKVNDVSQLVGKPVEVTLDRNCFHDFRILTEVL